jgi:uncharacterized membrane protein
MKPLLVLLIASGVALLLTKIFYHSWNYHFAGNLGMSIMLLFTAIGHFAFNKGMAMMLPDFIPFKRKIIYGTGLIEILAAIGLLLPPYRHLTSVLLVIFFALILPANIYAAAKKVDYQKGTYDGSGINYLWFRVPLQIFFIGWTWYFGIYR